MIIDIENEVFTKIKNDIPTAKVLSSYQATIPSFPCIIVEETSNNNYDVTNDNTGEHHNDVLYEINIFSDVKNKKTQVKNLRNKVDNIMSGLYNMSRTFSKQTPNYSDENVYRYTLRYTAIVDENKTIWRK